MTTSESDIYDLYLAYKSYDIQEHAQDLRETQKKPKRSEVTLFVFGVWKDLWLSSNREIPTGAWEMP